MSDEINLLGLRLPLMWHGSEPKSPEAGDVYLDTSDGNVGNIMFYDGTTWCELVTSAMDKPSFAAEELPEAPYPMLTEDYDRAMEMIKDLGVEFE